MAGLSAGLAAFAPSMMPADANSDASRGSAVAAYVRDSLAKNTLESLRAEDRAAGETRAANPGLPLTGIEQLALRDAPRDVPDYYRALSTLLLAELQAEVAEEASQSGLDLNDYSLLSQDSIWNGFQSRIDAARGRLARQTEEQRFVEAMKLMLRINMQSRPHGPAANAEPAVLAAGTALRDDILRGLGLNNLQL